MKQVSNEYSDGGTGVDVKCSHCGAWLSDCEGLIAVVTHTEYGFIYKCGFCDLHTYWNCELAPAPLESDHRGIPL